VKVQQTVPDDQKTSALGTVAGFGALLAVNGNVLFGRFSDRTTSRFGRRRPWIVRGTVVNPLGAVRPSTTMSYITAVAFRSEQGRSRRRRAFLDDYEGWSSWES
jgi:MFS family permease